MKEQIKSIYQRAQMAARVDLPADHIINICEAFIEMHNVLEKIESFAPREEPSRELAYSGNYDDIASYGEDAAYASLAIMAKGCLKKVNDLSNN